MRNVRDSDLDLNSQNSSENLEATLERDVEESVQQQRSTQSYGAAATIIVAANASQPQN